jgi:hypothetical protein
MRAVLLVAALLLVGCEDTYRYPCQDPANKDKAECNRPACEADGMCYDSLNGMPPKAAAEPQVEETPAPVAELNNTEEVTGE